MIIVMAVSLFTGRVILQKLGITDYGIYNVVGGVITMIGVLKGLLAGSTSRFITVAIGKGDKELTRKTFCLCLEMYMILCIIIVFLAETFGLWFLNNKLVIPEERIEAANWVYQFTILSMVNGLLAGPYNATILSREKMKIYAYISVFEAFYKLAIVYLLSFFSFDRLIFYAFLILFGEVIVRMIYRTYCIRKFPECHFKFYMDKVMFKEILSYSTWNLFGTTSLLVKGQGLNLLLNVFFNPAVNAARGIAYSINTSINHFVTNFFTAVRPQIIKYYVQDDNKNMFKLVLRSSKMSYFLIFVLSLPIIIETPFIINLWLGQLPEHVVIFTRYIIAISAIEGIVLPIDATAQAVGKLSVYQSIIGILIMFNIPVSYILLKYGFPPITVFVVSLIITICSVFLRLILIKKLVKFSIFLYIKEVILKCILVTIISSVLPLSIKTLFPNKWYISIFICFVCIISTVFTIYCFGLKHEEKETVKKITHNKILKYHGKNNQIRN